MAAALAESGEASDRHHHSPEPTMPHEGSGRLSLTLLMTAELLPSPARASPAAGEMTWCYHWERQVSIEQLSLKTSSPDLMSGAVDHHQERRRVPGRYGYLSLDFHLAMGIEGRSSPGEARGHPRGQSKNSGRKKQKRQKGEGYGTEAMSQVW